MIGTVKNRWNGKYVWLGLQALFVPVLSFAFEFDGSIEVQSQASFSRLKISIDDSFKPEIHDSVKGFQIVIPSATLMDVGVPFGAEEKFNEFLKSIRDSRLDHIKVREKEASLIIEGDYHFPTGAQAFADPHMEHFDFRRDEQGKFIVDFFYKKGPTRADVERLKRTEAAARLIAQREAIKKREIDKKDSREKRIQDSRNALLFCEQPFNRNSTVFLRFKAEHPALKFSAYFPEKVPDHRFEYAEPKGTSEEAEMVRLALKLSRDNQHALSIKTVEFLEKQYPKSKYKNEMLFLKANALYRLGFEDKGRELIQDIARKARGSEVGLQAAGFLAAQSFENKEWLAALESFMNLKKEMPKHPLVWLFRYGIAESLFQIKQTEQAIAEYEWLSKNAPKPEIRAEAAFKMGDGAFERGQYAQAATFYSAAIKNHESYLAHYPNVLLNLGESYFQLEEVDRAAAAYQKYLQLAQNQPAAWRASLRLAEITAMKQSLSAEAEKAFTETINRYPISPGAIIARLRLLPCGGHAGFDESSAERFLGSPEVTNFTGDGAVYATLFRELVALSEVRMLISFKQDQKAIEKGIEHLRTNPGVETRKLIEHAMIGGINTLIEKKLNAGDPFGAIAIYEKYGDFLPLPAHDPLADELKMKIASIAAEKNLTQLALKIIGPYRQMNEATQKEVVAAIEKHLTLEGIDDQEERNLIEAKTLWNSPQFKVGEESEVSHLEARLGFIREESKQSFEKNLILGLLSQEKKDFKKSEEHAKLAVARMQKLSPRAKVQVWGWAGDVANQALDVDFAQKAYREARIILAGLKDKDEGELTLRHLSAAPTLAYLFQNEGEMLEKQHKWKEAVALYSEAIENKIGGNHVLYAHARALLKDGGRDSKKIASRSLEKIQQSQDDDVWKRLAQDTLKEIAKEGKVDEKRNP